MAMSCWCLELDLFLFQLSKSWRDALSRAKRGSRANQPGQGYLWTKAKKKQRMPAFGSPDKITSHEHLYLLRLKLSFAGLSA